MATAFQLEDRQFHLICKALSDPHRYEMLQSIAVAKDAPSCGCVREALGLSAATISHHLKELENAGLVEIEREGKYAFLKLRRDVWKAYLKRLNSL